MSIAAALTAAIVWGVHVLSGSPQPIAARLALSTNPSSSVRLTIQEFGGAERAPIRTYDRDMTKLLHLIVVDHALTTFMHVHPVLDRAGVFRIGLRLAHGGRWHIYADAMPHNFSRQVFRFDVDLPGRTLVRRAALPSAQSTVRAGPYVIALDRTMLQAGKNTMVAVHVERDGSPAGDLRPFLGARAHAVLIGPNFSYIHSHAMSAMMAVAAAMPMASMGSAASASPPPDDGCGNDVATGMSLVELPPNTHVGPDMAVMLRPGAPGRYHLWLQFRDRSHVYTAPFVIQVRG